MAKKEKKCEFAVGNIFVRTNKMKSIDQQVTII